MKDVRAQLIKFAEPWLKPSCRADVFANDFSARFEVTPKPVISDDGLGSLVSKAAGGHTGSSITVGQKMWCQLQAAGLTIVRIEEAS